MSKPLPPATGEDGDGGDNAGCLKFDSEGNQFAYTWRFNDCAGSIPIVKIFHNYNIFLIHVALPRVVYRLLRVVANNIKP